MSTADSASAVDRTAKWLAGDRLSCVLHIGDGMLAYQLSDQGHEVVIAGDDAVTVRNSDIQYVRTAGDRLPFAQASFDVVVVPQLGDSPVALAEYARVLRPDGLVSTLSRQHDETIPWTRKLRELIGSRADAPVATDVFAATGLFDEPEVETFATWEQLDLAALIRFAHDTGDPATVEAQMSHVHQLFSSYGSHAGFLRLRHETECLRARVIKDALEFEPEPAAATLLDFA